MSVFLPRLGHCILLSCHRQTCQTSRFFMESGGPADLHQLNWLGLGLYSRDVRMGLGLGVRYSGIS